MHSTGSDPHPGLSLASTLLHLHRPVPSLLNRSCTSTGGCPCSCPLLSARGLSSCQPSPLWASCSQVAWLQGLPALVKSPDFTPCPTPPSPSPQWPPAAPPQLAHPSIRLTSGPASSPCQSGVPTSQVPWAPLCSFSKAVLRESFLRYVRSTGYLPGLPARLVGALQLHPGRAVLGLELQVHAWMESARGERWG